MPKLSKLCLVMFILYIGNLYADKNSDIFDSLLRNSSNFPSCNVSDPYWYDTIGDDFVSKPQINESTLYLQGDNISGQESGIHFVSGNIIAYKGDQTLTADWLIYNQKKSNGVGSNVVLTRQYNAITGSWADYYFDLDSGIIKEATAKDSVSNLYITGDEIKIANKYQYQASNGFVTSCDPKNPSWHIKSEITDVDYQDSQGTARRATFYVESIPIVYTPYFQFPLGKRRSGFLMPELGGISGANYNTGAGFQGINYFVGIPYYWNMSSNYDMTIEAKLYSLSGLMVTDQFRYLDSNGTGEIYTEQLPSDWQIGQYRYYWRLSDNHELAKDWSAGYTFNSVSDSDYFVDFGNANSFADNINLERSAFIRYSPYWGVFDVAVQGYQTLNPTGQYIAPPIYSALPQINFNVKQTQISNTWFTAGFNSQYSNFRSGVGMLGDIGHVGSDAPPLQDGSRIVVYPSVTLPIQKTWGYVTPKLGYNYTYYQLLPYSGFYPSGGTVSRQLPITSIDSGLFFDKSVSMFDSGFVHTIEPKLYYLYIPQTSQSNLPVFDTAVATPNLNQLFSENRFSGYDRINSANDLTIGLTSQFLNDSTGSEISNWGVGYRYYLTPSNNLLYGSYTQFGQLYQPTPNLIAELSNNWAYDISTGATFQYDSLFKTVDGYSLQLKYNPEAHKVINARYTYQYQMPVFYYGWAPSQSYAPLYTENQYAIDLSGQWPLFSQKWLLDGRFNYDLTKRQMMNSIGGLEYNGGCWSVALVYERFATNTANDNGNYSTQNQYTAAYYIQFSLGGLTTIGTGDPTNDLKAGIPGYSPVTLVK